MLRAAFGRSQVVSTTGPNRGVSGVHSPVHAPDIVVRDAMGIGQPLLVEVRVLAAEAREHQRFDSPLGPHLQRLRHTVTGSASGSGYERCRGITRGALAVAVIDHRGGLGPGATIDGVWAHGVLRDRVRILGATDIFAMCAARAGSRREAHHARDSLRGCPASFTDYYRRRLCMAVRMAIAASLRSAGAEVPAGMTSGLFVAPAPA
jgi:hypothetical protein